jgi:hypothetical protein
MESKSGVTPMTGETDDTEHATGNSGSVDKQAARAALIAAIWEDRETDPATVTDPLYILYERAYIPEPFREKDLPSYSDIWERTG